MFLDDEEIISFIPPVKMISPQYFFHDKIELTLLFFFSTLLMKMQVCLEEPFGKRYP
jgi:hypothetical protein